MSVGKCGKSGRDGASGAGSSVCVGSGMGCPSKEEVVCLKSSHARCQRDLCRCKKDVRAPVSSICAVVRCVA